MWQMTRAVALIAGVVVAFLGCAAHAEACTCSYPRSACEAYWTAGAVFDATVEKIGLEPREENIGTRTYRVNDHRVTLQVRAAYKAVATGPLDVITASHGSACGFAFKPGERYLVFATRQGGGEWHVSRCSPTQPFDGTGESAAFLASLTGTATGGRVFGRVNPMYDPLQPDDLQARTSIEATLRLIGGRERTVTTSGGRFEFAGVEPGAYRLEIKLPPGYIAHTESRFVNLENARACVEEDFGVAYAGRIIGVIRDVNGRAPRVMIEVARADARRHPDYGLRTRSAMALNDGAFEITGLAPGQYVLGVNLEDRPARFHPYARTVYPSDGTGDVIITIGVDHTHDIGEWRLPPPRLPRSAHNRNLLQPLEVSCSVPNQSRPSAV